MEMGKDPDPKSKCNPQRGEHCVRPWAELGKDEEDCSSEHQEQLLEPIQDPPAAIAHRLSTRTQKEVLVLPGCSPVWQDVNLAEAPQVTSSANGRDAVPNLRREVKVLAAHLGAEVRGSPWLHSSRS